MLFTAPNTAKARTAAKELAVGIVEPLAIDVANLSSIRKAAAELPSRYDYLDVLVNNAGINYKRVENTDINGAVMEMIVTGRLEPVLTRSSGFSLPRCPSTPPHFRFALRSLGVGERRLAGLIYHIPSYSVFWNNIAVPFCPSTLYAIVRCTSAYSQWGLPWLRFEGRCPRSRQRCFSLST